MLSLARIALIGFALLSGVLVLVAAAWNLKLPIGSVEPTSSVFQDPAKLNTQLRTQLAENDLLASATDESIVHSAAELDPLSDGVFILAALDSREQGRYREALNTLQVARQRDPRNRIARLLLADGYAREARAGEFVAEALALDQLQAGTSRLLIPVLARFATNPTTSAETITALRDSRLGDQVMSQLARDTVSPDLLLQFRFRPKRGGLISDEDRRKIDGLVRPYIDEREWSAAQTLWLDFYSHPEVLFSEVTDGDFRGELGPPFGWRFQQSAGIVELNSAGLELVHYGRSDWNVATQVLLLRPGSYRLDYDVVARNGDLSSLVWTVACLDGGGNLLTLSFDRSGLFDLAQRDTFVVPDQDCAAQQLSLLGRVDDAGSARSATIGSVEILPERAQ